MVNKFHYMVEFTRSVKCKDAYGEGMWYSYRFKKCLIFYEADAVGRKKSPSNNQESTHKLVIVIGKITTYIHYLFCKLNIFNYQVKKCNFLDFFARFFREGLEDRF